MTVTVVCGVNNVGKANKWVEAELSCFAARCVTSLAVSQCLWREAFSLSPLSSGYLFASSPVVSYVRATSNKQSCIINP